MTSRWTTTGRALARLAVLALVALVSLGATDSDPLRWDAPEMITAEATGPDGARVSYTVTVTTKGGAALPVTCSPPSGSVFPLGETEVTCTASGGDDPPNAGNRKRTFPVIVRDTTAPTISVPGQIVVSSPGGTAVPASSATIGAFLAAATARDVVDSTPTLTHDAPASFPLGTTTVTFRATDDANNASSASSTVTVTLAPPPAAEDRTAPADVAQARAATGSARVDLTWGLPADADLDRVEVARSSGPGPATVVYRGTATRFSDRGVRNGVAYAYVITSHDEAGNASGGVRVTARPRASRLVTPLDRAAVAAPPTLRWLTSRGATYYNVQLWARGKKILSRWPSGASLRLSASWTYRARRYRLTAGTYTWYVWPGYGARADARYGRLLGSRSFDVVTG